MILIPAPCRDYIQRHPLIAFFLAAFAFSWIIWILPMVVPGSEPSFLILIDVIGAFGPALAAIFLSGILSPEPTGIPPMKRWGLRGVLFILFFPLALTWPLLGGKFADPRFLVLCAILAALASFAVSEVCARTRGSRVLMSSIVRWRVSPVWYAIALAAWPVLILSSSLIGLIVSGQPLSPYFAGLLVIEPLSAVLLFVTIFFFGGPLQEEPGWRGFTLVRLETFSSPIMASVILGFMWQLWHIPLYFTGFYPFDAVEMGMRFVLFLPGAVVYTWLFNRTEFNLLIAVLFHASIDASPQILPVQTGLASNIFYVLMGVWAAVVIVRDQMWQKFTVVGQSL